MLFALFGFVLESLPMVISAMLLMGGYGAP